MTWSPEQEAEAIRALKRSASMRQALAAIDGIRGRALRSWWGHWQIGERLVRRPTIVALADRKLIYFNGSRWARTVLGGQVSECC